MNVIIDSVQSRRMIARTIVPCNIRALESKGLTVTDLDGIEYRVADKVAFFPRNGFWRFLDGSRQGYGASRLIPALAGLALQAEHMAKPTLDPMVERLRKPEKKNSEKPVTGRDSVAAVRTASIELPVAAIAESVTGHNPEKPVAGRDNVPAKLEATELHQHVESVTGPLSLDALVDGSASLLPVVSP